MVRERATRGMTHSTASKRITAQYADQRGVTDAGREGHQTADGDTPVLVMQQAFPSPTLRICSGSGRVIPQHSQIFAVARRAATLTMSVSLCGWCMPLAAGRLDIASTVRRLLPS